MRANLHRNSRVATELSKATKERQGWGWAREHGGYAILSLVTPHRVNQGIIREVEGLYEAEFLGDRITLNRWIGEYSTPQAAHLAVERYLADCCEVCGRDTTDDDITPRERYEHTKRNIKPCM